MTPIEKLQSVLDELNELKKKLIPITYVTEESNNNLSFFQDVSIDKLKDNQSVNYENVSQVVEKMMDVILDYVAKLEKMNPAPLDITIDSEFIITDKNVTDNVILTNKKASQLTQYASNSKEVLSISNIQVDTFFSVYNKTDDKEIEIEPIVYWLIPSRKKIIKLINTNMFTPETIFGVLLVGIKLKEEIKANTELTIENSFNVKLLHTDLSIKSESFTLFDTPTTFSTKFDLLTGDVPFFAVVDFFGNDIHFKDSADNYFTVAYNKPINVQNVKKYIPKLYVNDALLYFFDTERLVAYPYKAYLKKQDDITFSLIKTPEYKDALYFPAMSPLGEKLKKAIDEI